MSKVLRVRLQEDTYDLIKRMARASGKSLSKFSAELLESAAKQELKDTNLLNRLIQKIENLSDTPAQNSLQVAVETGKIEEKIDELKQVFFELFAALELFFIHGTENHRKFITRMQEILNKFNPPQ